MHIETKYLTIKEALLVEPKSVLAIEEPSDAIDGIEDFKNLVKLNLSGNQNVKSFGFLKKLKKLEELDLGNLELNEIPSEVGTLKKLQTLDIGKNAITAFSILGELPELISLGLKQLGLRKVPTDILGLKTLKVLGLQDNDITSLSSLKALTGLEKLYAGSNRLKKIPKELKKLKHLRFLDVSGNWTLKDCEVVSELTELEGLLICSGYEMARFPAGLFKLSKLTCLMIYVHSKSESDAIDGLADHCLEDLEQLSIQNSSLSSLPDSVSKMKKLRILTLRNNEKLTNIDAIRDLPELKTLNLDRNEIEILGEGFSTLKKLEFLNVNFNNLSDVSGLRDLPLLKELHLFTKLESLPETLGTLSALENLQLSAKGSEVSFLEKLTNLKELYIAGCAFAALPKSLGKTVKTLTVFRDSGDDNYLEAFEVLENLTLCQSKIALPALPSLKTLSVSGAENGIDFENIAGATALRTLKIHRTKTMKTLPPDLSKATQVLRLELEFLKELDDISALGPLEDIETLKMSYCDNLISLTALGSKPNLKELELYSLPCLDLDIVPDFGSLEGLILTRVEELSALPEGLSALPNLRKVHLKDVDELNDISVLERCISLVDFECRGDGPKRKSIAKVNASIANRDGNVAALKTSYATFMVSMYKELTGKEDASNTYAFPLWFDTPENLLEEIREFGWVGEHLYGEDGELKDILTKPEHGLKPLAALDWGYEGCDMDSIDAYSEEFFLVDTESPLNPVFLWGHDSKPTEVYPSFDAFLNNIRDFVLD